MLIYTVPIKYEYLNETICVKEEYEFGDRLISEPGIYYDTLQTYEQCDSIILLDLFVQGVSQTEVNAKVFQGETYSLDLYDFHKPGTYNLNLISSIGCDSLIKLNLALYDIFIPNIFSPNDDGVNDVFEVYSNEPLIKLERLEIFSRWGSKVYQNESSTSDIAFSWDGTLNQQKVGNGLYSYVLTLLLENGKQKLITGNVSVMK